MPKKPSIIVPADEIIQHFGGPSRLAELLCCTPQNISMWQGVIPHKAALDILILAKGKWLPEQMPVRRTARMQSIAAA
jgi:DNA-binding transcriptional regulator Cro